MAQDINVLVVEPGKDPCPAQVPNTFEAFEEIVGGPVDTGCYLPQRVIMVCQENGREKGLPVNRAHPGTGENIFGTFLLCGFEDNSLISLTADQQAKFQRLFADPGGVKGGDAV